MREEADPFSMDLGVLGRGHIVKVMEVRDVFVAACGRGVSCSIRSLSHLSWRVG